jgi:hypothetical protein
MRTRHWLLLGALGLALVGAGCAAEKKRIGAADIAGTVVLEHYRVNLGWNYELKGMYIDGDGGVWAYEQHGTPWFPDRLTTGELSERDLLTKHKGARRIGTVDLPQLVEMARLVPGAAKGPVTRAHPAHEGGGAVDVAYRLDKATHTYQEIILSGSGDLTATNGSGEARALLDYLRQVEAQVGYAE